MKEEYESVQYWRIYVEEYTPENISYVNNFVRTLYGLK
jgi:hypothetical protein